MHRLFEHPSPVLVILKLIEAGAGRSKKNNVAGHSRFAGASDGIFQSLSMFDFSSTLNLRFDLGGRGSYGVDALHPLSQ